MSQQVSARPVDSRARYAPVFIARNLSPTNVQSLPWYLDLELVERELQGIYGLVRTYQLKCTTIMQELEPQIRASMPSNLNDPVDLKTQILVRRSDLADRVQQQCESLLQELSAMILFLRERRAAASSHLTPGQSLYRCHWLIYQKRPGIVLHHQEPLERILTLSGERRKPWNTPDLVGFSDDSRE
jgi:hypothetical protein